MTNNAGHNNGRVTQTIDGVLGETVNYQYDYLHRLTAATATNNAWGEAYSYDGFGNLTAKTPTVGSAPTFSGSAGSNAQNGSLPGQWDVENRPMTQGSTFYVYDPWGRRIWKQWTGQTGANECEAYFYGATGQKLESYSCEYTPNTIDWFTTLEGINTYFGGKMLSEKGVAVLTDRLGSVRANSNGESFSYFPWGEERGTGTADGRTKFAGYYRDQPGQDYAMARYYSATTGSFWSPDPGGMNNANAANPTTWNRYDYVMGDPINRTDVNGLCSDQDNPPCFSTNSAPPPPGPTPGSPVQGTGNDSPPVDLGGGDPGGSGSSTPSNADLLSASIGRVTADLLKPECAKDFKNVSKTVNELSNISFHDYGEATVSTNKAGKNRTKGGQWGQYNPFTHSINLNSNSSVNWADPSHSMDLLNGVQTPSDFIAGELSFLGLPATTPMTASQFIDLVVLHELAHYDGRVGNPDKGANEIKLWNDCVKQ